MRRTLVVLIAMACVLVVAGPADAARSLRPMVGSELSPGLDPLAAAGVTRPSCVDLRCADVGGLRVFLEALALPLEAVVGNTVFPGAACGAVGAGPTGDLRRVELDGPVVGLSDRVTRVAVEVEEGIDVDPECFAEVVAVTLGDPRGWIRSGHAFQLVSDGPVDVVVTLATPAVVDSFCAPLQTNGIFSCWNGRRAMINLVRWQEGATDFGSDLAVYRIYVINHEVGHALGFGHVGCPASGAHAPVMMQQTKSVGACIPNAWPTDEER